MQAAIIVGGWVIVFVPIMNYKGGCLDGTILAPFPRGGICWVKPWSGSNGLINFDGLVHDCSNSIALAMELLQSCTKPSNWLIT